MRFALLLCETQARKTEGATAPQLSFLCVFSGRHVEGEERPATRAGPVTVGGVHRWSLLLPCVAVAVAVAVVVVVVVVVY